MRRVAFACAALAVCGAIVTLVQHQAPAHRKPTRSPSENPAPSARISTSSESPATVSPGPKQPPDPRIARRADPEPGEADHSLRWDDLARSERVEILRQDLDTAIEALEAGDTDIRHVAVAESAISALRVELYDTERGRTTHRGYETRLDRALAARSPAAPTPLESLP